MLSVGHPCDEPVVSFRHYGIPAFRQGFRAAAGHSGRLILLLVWATVSAQQSGQSTGTVDSGGCEVAGRDHCMRVEPELMGPTPRRTHDGKTLGGVSYELTWLTCEWAPGGVGMAGDSAIRRPGSMGLGVAGGAGSSAALEGGCSCCGGDSGPCRRCTSGWKLTVPGVRPGVRPNSPGVRVAVAVGSGLLMCGEQRASASSSANVGRWKGRTGVCLSCGGGLKIGRAHV